METPSVDELDDVEYLFSRNQEEYNCSLDSDSLSTARRDLREDRVVRHAALKEIREWVISQPHIVRCRLDSNFLLRFLRVNKYRIPQAKAMLERYLSTRISHPHWFQSLDLCDPNLNDLISKGFVFALPERDDNGRRVIFGIGTALNPDMHTPSHTMRAIILTLETLMEDECNHVRGFTYIFDQKNVGIRAATMWTPTAFRKALHCTERCLPTRHKQCHFIHLPLIIVGLFEFFKTFLSPKLRQRIMVHSEMTSLCKNVPMRILPLEYGGQVPLQHMLRLWKQEVMAKRNLLLSMDLMHIDEDLRITNRTNRDLQFD